MATKTLLTVTVKKVDESGETLAEYAPKLSYADRMVAAANAALLLIHHIALLSEEPDEFVALRLGMMSSRFDEVPDADGKDGAYVLDFS